MQGRSEPRLRTYVGPGLLRLVRPFFRYSYFRDAYVLRLVGERYGPVLKVRSDRPRSQPRRRGSGDRRRLRIARLG